MAALVWGSVWRNVSHRISQFNREKTQVRRESLTGELERGVQLEPGEQQAN